MDASAVKTRTAKLSFLCYGLTMRASMVPALTNKCLVLECSPAVGTEAAAEQMGLRHFPPGSSGMNLHQFGVYPKGVSTNGYGALAMKSTAKSSHRMAIATRRMIAP